METEIDRLRADAVRRIEETDRVLVANGRLRADNAAKDARIQELEVAIGIIIKERDEANFAGAELREKLEKPLNFQWETGGAELAAMRSEKTTFIAQGAQALAEVEAQLAETQAVLRGHVLAGAAKDARIAELEANAVETELEWSKLCAERERAIIARAESAEASLLYEATETRIAMEQLQDRAERAEARVAELEATILHWTSEVTRLEQNCDDDQDRAERAEDALKEQLQWKKSYTERAERAEAELKAYQQDYKAVHSITELREVRAERDAMLEVCVGVNKVASIEEEIGFSKDWTPMWRDTVTRARAALAPSPAGREG